MKLSILQKFAPVLHSKEEIIEFLRGMLDAELRINMAPLDFILRDIGESSRLGASTTLYHSPISECHGRTGSMPNDMQQWVEEAHKEMMAEYNGLLYGGDV
jgi:hypothetical protein